MLLAFGDSLCTATQLCSSGVLVFMSRRRSSIGRAGERERKRESESQLFNLSELLKKRVLNFMESQILSHVGSKEKFHCRDGPESDQMWHQSVIFKALWWAITNRDFKCKIVLFYEGLYEGLYEGGMGFRSRSDTQNLNGCARRHKPVQLHCEMHRAAFRTRFIEPLGGSTGGGRVKIRMRQRAV